MNAKQKIIDILIVVLVPVTVFTLYRIFLYQPTIPNIQSAGGSSVSPVSELEMKIHVLEGLKLDSSLFKMQAFERLVDNTVIIDPLPVRDVTSNPFQPNPKTKVTVPGGQKVDTTQSDLSSKLDQLKKDMGR